MTFARLRGSVGTAVGALLLPVLAWPAVGTALWAARGTRPMTVLVYDQTVPDDTYLEHASLALAFEHVGVRFPVDGHVGAAPGGRPWGAWPSTRPDLVVLADAYGVYTDASGAIDDEGTHRVTDILDERKAADLAAWERSGTWILGEFNDLHPPTPPEASETLQTMFGIDLPGWAGRRFDDLADVPDRVRRLAGDWPYEGPGLVILGGAVGDRSMPPAVVVLTEDELDGPLPIVEGRTPDGVEVSVPFLRWFEVADAVDAQILAELALPVNDRGRAVLASAGIPERWPFLLRHRRTVYVAGDASENTVGFPLRRIAGAGAVMRRLPHTDDAAFFYRLYLPTIAWLVDRSDPSAAVEAGP